MRPAPIAPIVERAKPVAVPSAELLGVPLAIVDYERTLAWVDATVAEPGRGYICVAAVHTVMASREDPELRAAVRGARASPCPTASRLCGRSTPSVTGCPPGSTGRR